MFAALPPAPPAAVSTPVVAAADTHRVRPGDTVSGIALRYGVTRGPLRAANDIGPDDIVRVGERLTIPADAAPASRSASRRPAESRGSGETASTSTVRRAIVDAARRHDVDPDLALAVGWQESRWRQHVVSHAGARGAMQCMPVTGEWMSEKAGRRLDLRDVGDNATCGVMLLDTLRQSADREATVLAAYYQGMRSVKEDGVYASTRDYVRSVQAHRDRIAAGQAPRG